MCVTSYRLIGERYPVSCSAPHNTCMPTQLYVQSLIDTEAHSFRCGECSQDSLVSTTVSNATFLRHTQSHSKNGFWKLTVLELNYPFQTHTCNLRWCWGHLLVPRTVTPLIPFEVLIGRLLWVTYFQHIIMWFTGLSHSWCPLYWFRSSRKKTLRQN